MLVAIRPCPSCAAPLAAGDVRCPSCRTPPTPIWRGPTGFRGVTVAALTALAFVSGVALTSWSVRRKVEALIRPAQLGVPEVRDLVVEEYRSVPTGPYVPPIDETGRTYADPKQEPIVTVPGLVRLSEGPFASVEDRVEHPIWARTMGVEPGRTSDYRYEPADLVPESRPGPGSSYHLPLSQVRVGGPDPTRFWFVRPVLGDMQIQARVATDGKAGAMFTILARASREGLVDPEEPNAGAFLRVTRHPETRMLCLEVGREGRVLARGFLTSHGPWAQVQFEIRGREARVSVQGVAFAPIDLGPRVEGPHENLVGIVAREVRITDLLVCLQPRDVYVPVSAPRTPPPMPPLPPDQNRARFAPTRGKVWPGSLPAFKDKIEALRRIPSPPEAADRTGRIPAEALPGWTPDPRNTGAWTLVDGKPATHGTSTARLWHPIAPGTSRLEVRIRHRLLDRPVDSGPWFGPQIVLFADRSGTATGIPEADEPWSKLSGMGSGYQLEFEDSGPAPAPRAKRVDILFAGFMGWSDAPRGEEQLEPGRSRSLRVRLRDGKLGAWLDDVRLYSRSQPASLDLAEARWQPGSDADWIAVDLQHTVVEELEVLVPE